MRDKLSFSCKHTQSVCKSEALIRINAAPNKIKDRLTLYLPWIIIRLVKKGRQGNGNENINMFSYVLTSLPALKQAYHFDSSNLNGL